MPEKGAIRELSSSECAGSWEVHLRQRRRVLRPSRSEKTRTGPAGLWDKGVKLSGSFYYAAWGLKELVLVAKIDISC